MPYEKTTWTNDKTPLSAEKLNHMEEGIYNATQLAESGGGGTGTNGVTFTPSVSEDGVLSWSNDGGLPNPEDVNLKGLDGYTPVKGTDYWTEEDKSEIAQPFANAFKGNVSGEIIRVDDVSPVEHTAKAKVVGKNLFDMSRFITTNETTVPKIVEVGENYVTLNCPVGSYGNAPTYVKLATLCSNCEVGKTYVLTASSPSQHQLLYLEGANTRWDFGTARVVSEAMLNSIVVLYGYNMTQESEAKECTISNIQLEEGDTATEYESYIDPTTVTVTRCGKAVFSRKEFYNDEKKASWTSAMAGKVVVPNGSYVASCKFNQVGVDKSQTCLSIRRYDDYAIHLGNSHASATSGVLKVPFTVEGDSGFQICLYSNYSGMVLTTACLFEDLIVEVGDTSTGYEPYTAETYTPEADGTCEIVSVSPTMTLFTDTAGATIEVEYNRDTNKAVRAIVDESKAEIVDLVLEALPAAEEASF